MTWFLRKRRGHKLHAQAVWLATNGETYSRERLQYLAGIRGIAITRSVRRKKTGRTEEEPLTMRELAGALGIPGQAFDSKHEYRWYVRLKAQEQAGEIKNLRRQVRFDLHVKGTVVGHYVADFVATRDGRIVIFDPKGHITQTYARTRKMFAAEYGIQIQEL